MGKEYQGLAISNFRTGFDESLEPWMLPRDAYQILKNAHLYRGVLEKIAGYNLYAKMSYRETMQLSGVIDGVNKTFTGTLNYVPSTNNIIVQAAIDAGATTSEILSYDSDTLPNIINLKSTAGGTGTINLTTKAISVTFNTAPAKIPGGGNVYNSVTVSYDYLSSSVAGDLDIMGIKPYYASSGATDLLIFDTKRVGKIVNLSGLIAQNAGTDNGITGIPYDVQTENATPNPAFDGATLTFTGTSSAFVVPGTVNFVVYSNVPALRCTITDNGVGLLTGTGAITASGFINYATGAWTLTFVGAPAATDKLNTVVSVYGNTFSGDFKNFFSVTNYAGNAFITNNVDYIRYYNGVSLKYLNTQLSSTPFSFTYPITKCLHVAMYRERLCLLLPSVNGNVNQNSIYWSTTFNALDFTNNESLPAPTSEAIVAFSFINSDMIVKFSNSERVFRYTADAFSPFRWDTTNSIWRCDAKYSAINYDSFFTAIGKPAIVASDGVNVKRIDEKIPDFTLTNRNISDGPTISINQTSIGQCYGEKFDDFKEGWLCFKSAQGGSNSVSRSDNVLAFNYLDNTYSVYTFPLNCLGFGTVTASNVWGNDYDPWEDANYAWASFYESLGSLLDLGGDRYGKVYTLGSSNTLIDAAGVTQPILMDVISKNFNPFIEEGELCRLGYVDLLVSSNATSKLRIQFYRDDTLYVAADGNPAGAYQETILTFTPTDAMSPTTAQTKIWKRIYVGAVAREHTIRFYQNAGDFTADTLDQPIRIHSMVLYVKPAGRIFN